MNRPIGTCSLCGGTVSVYEGAWWGIHPPVPECESCGAVPAGGGPVIQMRPAPKTNTVTTLGDRCPHCGNDRSMPAGSGCGTGDHYGTYCATT